MIINTNPGAAMAARILGESSSALQKSLSRLSSGSRIASPSDDAAGTGVAMKFGAQINRIQAAKDNVGNAISFSQTQDGFLSKVGDALDRMSELAMLAQDETKTDQDRALYHKEYDKLDDFITAIKSKTFNGVNLFQSGAMTVTVASDGTTFGASGISLAKIGSSSSIATHSGVASSASAAASVTILRAAITALASDKATVGANMSRLESETCPFLCSKTTCRLLVAALRMWMWLKKVPTSLASRSWCSPERPCSLKLMCCHNRHFDSSANLGQGRPFKNQNQN